MAASSQTFHGEAYSFNMENIIIKYTNYINTVTGSVQWDERKLKLLYKSKIFCCCYFSVAKLSDSSQPHGLQHARHFCPSPFPGVFSSSCPLNLWCHQLSHSVTLFFPSISVFSNESVRIRCSKYWSFSISSSKEHLVLISFKINWFDLLAVQGTFKSKTENIKLD